MPRALVLGGETGLLGQSLVAELARNPAWEISTLGRNDGPVTDEAFLAKHIAAKTPTVIFNTIAWTQVDAAEDNPAEAARINADFPDLLARLLAGTDIHLIHFSTDFVFGRCSSTPHPFTEEESPQPDCVYGQTKLDGENAILNRIPSQAAVVRTAWLFGPRKKNFVRTIVDAAKKRSSLTVVADQIGTPTSTLDLATWSVRLAEGRKTGIWHAVQRGSASWYELAKRALELMGSTTSVTPIPSTAWPQKAKRPAYSVLSPEKLEHYLGEPVRTWENALADYVQNYLLRA